jgi:hypothetical protein
VIDFANIDFKRRYISVMEENNFKNRLKAFLAYLKIGQGKFENRCSISNGTVNNIKDGVSTSILEKIVTTYPELNIIWLLTGSGEMLTHTQNDSYSFLLSDQGSDAKEPILEEPPSTYQNAGLEYLKSMLIDRDRQIKSLQKDKEQLIIDKDDLKSDKQRLLDELYDLKAQLGRIGSQVEKTAG